MQNTAHQNADQTSPFHSGEKRLQTRAGKRDEMEQFGRRAIRSFMPDQHRDFYAQLPFMVVGSVDHTGWPWASIVCGEPGFVSSTDAKSLTLATQTLSGDPLANALKPGAPLGLLGIEMSTRRRNRVNAHVTHTTHGEFSLAVDQAFGNCPQYIQRRTVDFVRDPDVLTQTPVVAESNTLDRAASAMIEAADTFFVSSYIHAHSRPQVEGVDVSHRGGKPGFVKIDGNSLTVPDFPGNYHFNTLGNFLVNPKAGLVFLDFETGDVLQLTGTVEILSEDDAQIKAFAGAERGWRFTLHRAVRHSTALPFRSTLEEFSPNTLITGDWAQTEATLAAEAKRNMWRPYRLVRIEDESCAIRSFYFEPTDGDGLLTHEAGQFLTIRVTAGDGDIPVVRTYTASSAPGDSWYRISVKRERSGTVSSHLHERFKLGDIIEAKAPTGDFFVDPTENRPAVLLAGGVGITPMISMAQHVANEELRTRHRRSLTVFHAAQTTAQRAFKNAFRQLERDSAGRLRYYSFISKPEPHEKPGEDFNGSGHITADTLRQTLMLDDYDFYLCGPPSFMQALYDTLRTLGVRDVRIFAEAFGPASLLRRPDVGSDSAPVVEEADAAIIKFVSSGFEQRWNAGEDSVLEVAEKHGLRPAYGCRSGSCGSCATKLLAGTVAYRSTPSGAHANDEILICSAVPAMGSDTIEVDL